MITVYRENGKPFSEENSIVIINAQKSFDLAEAVCGGCGAKGFLIFYCSYTRWLDLLGDGLTKSIELELNRYRCGICGKTHVVAPGELIIPYSRHSLGFIVAALSAYSKRERTVRQIADDFQIVVSTLYRWVKRFREHYALLLGKLEAVSGDDGAHVENILKAHALPRRLFVFVETYGISFLQMGRKPATTRFFTLRGYFMLFSGGSP